MYFLSQFLLPFGRRFGFWLLAGAMLFATSTAHTEPALSADASQINLTPFVEYIEDAEGKLTFAEVSGAAASRFRPVAGSDDINLGFSDSTFWLRFPLATGNGVEEHRLLEVAYFKLDHLTFYAPDQPPVLTGQSYPLSSRPWPHRFYVFPVTLTDAPRYYYLQVRSQGTLTLPLTLWEVDAFASQTEKSYLGQSLYYGALLALIAYNFLIFLLVRERSFILYVLCAVGMVLSAFANNGVGRQFLWPDGISWSSHFPVSTHALTAMFSIYFSQNFLQTGTHMPRLHSALHLAALVFLLLAAAPFLGLSAHVMGLITSLTVIPAGLLVFTAGIQALRFGNKSARLFLLAWGMLWMSVIIAAMRSFNWLPTTTLTIYVLQFGSIIQMLLLSLALAERIRLERSAREAAQAETLSIRQSQVESLRQSEIRLEKTVAERTAELHKSLKNEQQVLERYIRFGSLISHEFRNPLAIIQSQLVLIEKEKQHGVDHAERRLSAISGATKRLGILFKEWLQSDRLRQKTLVITPFPIDMKPWLDGVFEDCRVCYPHHPFALHVPAELPTVQADESLLRIALLNLADNAAKYSAAGTDIVIEGLAQNNRVGIAVTDQGAGIAPEQQKEIFSAYVRGSHDGATHGLGLGLAFVKRIVEMHHGEIELHSEEGKGCRFCIWLPCAKKELPHE